MPKWLLAGIACAAILIVAPLILASESRTSSITEIMLRKVSRHLPDFIYVGFNGAPETRPDVQRLLAAGAGITRPYRAIWQERFFANGATHGRGFLRICTQADPRMDCAFRSLDAAFAAVGKGQGLVLSAGIYNEAGVLKQDGVTLLAEPGAQLQGKAAQGKAALVIRGNDTLIQGLECSGIRVRDGNGACIRMEGRNLTLQGVYFHDSQEGILSGGSPGTITIEDSLFSRLGYGGRAHAIYIGGGEDSALIVRRSHFLDTRGQGHGIKSRARSNLIENSVIASRDSEDSRAIDLSNGGHNVIRSNVIQEGAHSSNYEVIGIGLEKRTPAKDAADETSEITGNLFILDRPDSVLVDARNVPQPVFDNNIVVGGAAAQVPDGNVWIRSRNLAGLGPPPNPLGPE